jgi:hypothetical protein
MLPRERVQVAFERGKPDQVPILLECDYDYIAAAAGREPWEWVYADTLEQAKIHEAHFTRHLCDLWPCWQGPSKSALKRRRIVREENSTFYVDLQTGRRFKIAWSGDLLDENGKAVEIDGDGDPLEPKDWVAGGGYPRAVETEDDILELVGPVPPADFWIEDGFLSNLAYLLPRYGQTYFLTFPLNTIFADALDLFGGFQEGLVALHTKRKLFHKVLATIVEWKKSRLRAGASLGAPGTWMIEYMTGADIISPATYREYVFPYEQEVAREAHRLGLKVYLWYLGDVTPLLPDIGRLEIDALFPEQGRKGYDVDIVEIRRRLGDGICLIGFNKERDLIEGDRNALAYEIRRQMQGAGQNGAFIMGTTIVTADANVEHVDWYVKTARRLGRYPD